MNYYVRFGKIPENKKSGIYHYDEGKIDEEAGVSCYRASIEDNKVFCILSIKEMYDSCVYNFAENAILGYKYVRDNPELSNSDEDCTCHKEYSPVYLITGTEVGNGSSGEPLLKNVVIKNKLKYADNCLVF